ncbi:hypothetical protein BDY17DRAFT_307471 [Neohortaea acidophila]|uniref:SET domain-containing protein n=1 Tax=Neohortaea acidophila TaxID=245834 RepID=A0A6A6Q9E2_9PEZI|nr:uncharacterized protein BDY17DRAFT_307471 [Neohortaea acidophila]KAF2488213.1 hypothetical protein BDY17DRAFT_307471 [Neohortaea acidophila]
MPSIRVDDTASAPAIADSSHFNGIYFSTDGTNDAQRDRTNDRPATSLNISHTRSRAATPPTPLNPRAPEFIPSYKHPNSPRADASVDGLEPFHQHVIDGVVIRMTPDKGWGVFTCNALKRGTLIIKEPPLIAIATDSPSDAWLPYCRLGKNKTKVYDSLHSYANPGLALEQLSRQYLLELDDFVEGEEYVNALVAEHVRVMSIFAVNQMSITPTGRGVFANTSRLNHSCVPNAYACWNPTQQQMTVYAIRDILPGEELCVSYSDGDAQFAISIIRQEQLGWLYNFRCTCPACEDQTGASDARRELMTRLVWGLDNYDNGNIFTSHPYIPAEPIYALRQAQDLVSLLLQEGLFDTELSKAYRRASGYALDLRDFQTALKHAYHEKDNERCCLGAMIDDLRRTGSASECWLEVIYDVIMREQGLEAVTRYRTKARGIKKRIYKKATKAVRKMAASAKNGNASH